jgi:hypothetical protein
MWSSVAEFLAVIPRYPTGSKALFVAWIIFTAIVIAAAVLTHPG